MADQRFYEAFLIPSATWVIGKKIKPFCLRHRIFLEAIGSPFFSDDKDREITQSDLIIALKICADEPIGSPTLADRWLALRLWLSPALFRQGCKGILWHIDSSRLFPKFWERTDRQGSGSGASLPWHLIVACNLIKSGISYQDAFNMPEAKAIWLSSAFSIMGGAKLEILTTDDEALLDQLAKVEPSKPNE
jgi:hypothetical protein